VFSSAVGIRFAPLSVRHPSWDSDQRVRQARKDSHHIAGGLGELLQMSGTMLILAVLRWLAGLAQGTGPWVIAAARYRSGLADRCSFKEGQARDAASSAEGVKNKRGEADKT
jgi:hypothetical protein